MKKDHRTRSDATLARSRRAMLATLSPLALAAMSGTAAAQTVAGESSAAPAPAVPAVETSPRGQTAGATPQTVGIENDDQPVVGEVVVTAQKRSESVQQVPIAISALGSEALAARGVVKLEALQQSVPGLVFSESVTGVGLVTIRGVGGSATRGSTPGRNPAVPVHANGVYLQSPSIMLQDFLDVDRVEVLRGPQGTLYGRNAVGGSINVITKMPGDTFKGEVGGEVGNYGQRKIYGILSGPVTERFRARLAAAVQQRDGYVTNVNDPDQQLLNSDYANVRLTLQYDLTSNLEATVIGYYYKNTGAFFALRYTSFPSPIPGFPSLYDPVPANYLSSRGLGVRRVANDTPSSGIDKTKGVSGELKWDLGGVSLRSITGFFDAVTGVKYDGDGTDIAALRSVTFFTSKYRTLSEELQLASDTSGPLKWLLGGYYYHEKSSYEGAIDALGPNPFLVDLTNPARIKSESVAVFGQADYEILPSLTLTGGLRYTHDSMDVRRSVGFYLSGVPIFAFRDQPASDSWSKVTWKLGANYRFNRNAMIYANYSRGYKSGGYNIQDNLPSFAPEVLDAYEAGFKSQLFQRRLQLNGSVYYYDYSNKQELVNDPTGFSAIQNAGAATLYGVELETIARATNRLSLDASVSYIHSRYDRFVTSDPDHPERGVQDLAGNQLTDAPKWQVHAGGQYALPLGDWGSLTARGDYSYTNSKYVRPFGTPADRVPSYSVINARLTWESADKAWMVEAFVNNIADKDIVNSYSDTSPLLTYIHQNLYLPPRTYGLKLRRSF